MIKIQAEKIGKTYNNRRIFSDIDFFLSGNESLVITGPNGSGKSTLLKIICGITRQSKGELRIAKNERELDFYERHRTLGLVAPDLEMYGELSALENLEFFSKVRGLKKTREELKDLISKVGLDKRWYDLISTFSSGMKQRMKYASAILHEPEILLLDEPMSNLDENGKAIAEEIITEQKKKGILIVATNETGEYKYSDKMVKLGNGKWKMKNGEI